MKLRELPCVKTERKDPHCEGHSGGTVKKQQALPISPTTELGERDQKKGELHKVGDGEH